MLETVIKSTDQNGPLSAEELRKINAYWRAANYLSVGQIYLLDNPLLKQPLTLEHIKPRLLGHWGTAPGLNFIFHHKVKTTGFSRSALAERICHTGGVAWIIDMEVIRLIRLNTILYG